MIRAIRKFIDKRQRSTGLLKPGMWRVHYPEGWSTRMTYDVATDYAEMWGGKVHYIRYHDPVTEGAA